MSSSLTPRHLHFVGGNHSHNLFDDRSSNGTAPVDVDNEASLEEMELENRKRAVTMSILFCTLMVFYIGFCFYYQKVHKVRRRIGDSVHQHRGNGREEQLRSNRAVLDESSNAAYRARSDGHMSRMFDERRDKIRAVLVTKLLVDEGRNGGAEGAVTGANAGDKSTGLRPELLKQSTSDSLENNYQAVDIDIQATDTLSTSQETCDSASDIHCRGLQVTTTLSTVAATSSSTCVDFKKYADALQSSISSGTRFVCSPQSANYCSGAGAGCSNSNHSCHHTSGSSHPNVNSSHPSGNGNTTTMLSILQNEECNICLSYFQVGDRIAWSCKNQTQFRGSATTVNSDSICRHIFHAECIERWLLVREGCPVCRRSYFEDLPENDPGEVAIRNVAVRNDVGVESREGQVDLERGDNNNITGEEVTTSATSARVIAVEE